MPIAGAPLTRGEATADDELGAVVGQREGVDGASGSRVPGRAAHRWTRSTAASEVARDCRRPCGRCHRRRRCVGGRDRADRSCRATGAKRGDHRAGRRVEGGDPVAGRAVDRGEVAADVDARAVGRRGHDQHLAVEVRREGRDQRAGRDVVGEQVVARTVLVGASGGAGRPGLREAAADVHRVADDGLRPGDAVDLDGRQRVRGDSCRGARIRVDVSHWPAPRSSAPGPTRQGGWPGRAPCTSCASIPLAKTGSFQLLRNLCRIRSRDLGSAPGHLGGRRSTCSFPAEGTEEMLKPGFDVRSQCGLGIADEGH